MGGTYIGTDLRLLTPNGGVTIEAIPDEAAHDVPRTCDIFGVSAPAVVTRDAADAAPYAEALAPLGLVVVPMPLTRTEPAADPEALAAALDDGEYAAIVVASPRAAQELTRAAGRSRSPRTTLPELAEVWAVGPATKRVLDDAQVGAQLPPDVKDGADLAARLVAARTLAGKRVLVPRAEDGRTEALDVLRRAGAIVVDVPAYRTIAVAADDPSIRNGRVALLAHAPVCCMFAPSQVMALGAVLEQYQTSLAALATWMPPTAFCAIGETTAQALRTAGIRHVSVAPAPTPEGMAHAVRSVYPTRT